MAHVETELKFKFIKEPDLHKLSPTYLIYQIYFDVNDTKLQEFIKKRFGLETIVFKEFRIRFRYPTNQQEKTSFFLTLKSNGTLERIEYELESNPDECLYIDNNFKHIGSINKVRYVIKYNELYIEIDQYLDKLVGLYTAEIEFDKTKYTKETITDIIKNILGNDLLDITDDINYKNSNLCHN